jgi:outer membrane protein
MAAGHTYGASKALRFPEVTLTARSSFKDEIAALDIDMPPIKIQREIGSKEIYQAELELFQPLFTGGRLTHGIKAERERSVAQGAALRAEEMAAAFRCRSAYLDAMMAVSALESARASRERLGIIRRDVENLFTEGLADSIDLLDAALAVLGADQALAEGEVGQAVAMARLGALVGLASSESITLTEPINTPDRRPERHTTPDILRPELEQLTHLAQAADYGVSAARADFLPSLGGFAVYSVGKPNQDLFDNEWNDYLMVGLRLGWSFNLANRTGRSVAAAAERARSARARRENLLDELRVAVDTSLEQVVFAYETVERSVHELDLARRKFAMARDRQEAGTLSVNRLLEMEAELTAADHRHQAALIGYYLAESSYLYATGSPKVFGGLK